MVRKGLFLAILPAVVLLCHAVRTHPEVTMKTGVVRGLAAKDGNYSMYLGIPYAVVNPENPFGVANPQPAFDGVFIAQNESSECAQFSRQTRAVTGSLACLTVNVYVPNKIKIDKKTPVMVWIFGGGFDSGSNKLEECGPQYLVKKNVILVTVNYRLDVYGFMCLDVPSVPGNAGLKDQQMALKWVNDNIEAFGGDKGSVTLFGWSAGAGSIEYHVLNPISNKYISKAILQSSTVFTNGIIEKSNATIPLLLANKLGFAVTTISQALDVLKNVSTNVLIVAGKNLGIQFRPCIEKKFEGVQGFIVTSPKKLLDLGDYRAMPLIIGHTSLETKNLPPLNITAIRDDISKRFNFNNQNDLETAVELVTNFYIGSITNETQLGDGLINFNSDYTCNYGVHRSILYHVNQSSEPVYQYEFDYVGSHKNSMGAPPTTKLSGVGHGGELTYLFNGPKDKNTARDNLLIEKFATLWTNFAKHSDPTPAASDLLPVRWPRYDTTSNDYLHIGSELAVRQGLLHKRMAFWDLFYVAYGRYYWLN